MAFTKGVSGNPAGRKPGSRTRGSMINDALIAYSQKHNTDAKQAIIETLIHNALSGDTSASKLILERLQPAFKPVSLPIKLDKRLPKDPVKRAEKLIELTISGDLLIEEAKVLLDGMKTVLSIKEIAELEQRLQKLEALENVKASS